MPNGMCFGKQQTQPLLCFFLYYCSDGLQLEPLDAFAMAALQKAFEMAGNMRVQDGEKTDSKMGPF